MSDNLFIADLHLLPDARLDAKTSLFIDFLTQQNPPKTLYILGDLFDAWLGDDLAIKQYPSVIFALKQYSTQADIFLLTGNRDFLLGEDFYQHTGIKTIIEPKKITLNKQDYLLMHGDDLCTDDVAYQRFKAVMQHPIGVKILLTLSEFWRIKLVNFLKKISQLSQKNKSDAIMDVSQKTVDKLMAQYPGYHLIHGHTHRQNIHQKINYTRFVLGDWQQTQGNALVIDDNQPPQWQVIK